MSTARPAPRAALRALFLLAALAAVAPAAHAQDDATEARAKELYENGAALYEEGRYEEAILAWEEAYRLSSRPVLLFNIANAYERLGRYDEAIDALSRYRAFAKAEERESLDRRMQNLERRRDEARAAAVATQVAQPTQPTPTTPTPAVKSGPSPLPFVIMGAGVAGVGVGAVFGARSLSAGAEAEALCVGEALLCSGEAGPYLESAKRSALIADVSLITGAVLVVGGLGLGVFGKQGEAVSLSATPTSLTLSARF
ncbi:tetratricopeptide repeat protein [Myxococcota bacterium]|nr:tetratricopeptide repeat protein [Myxococcota bacterium]